MTESVGVPYAPGGAAMLPDLYRASLGVCEVVILLRREHVTAEPELLDAAEDLFDRVLTVDADWVQHPPTDLAGLVCFNDEYVDAVDTALGRDPAAWDKLRQRELLARADATRIQARGVDSPEDLRAAVAELRLPGVLKPRRGVGGAGVTFLDSPARLEDVARTRRAWSGLLYEQLIPTGRHPSGVEWLADHVSVETVSTAAGRHHVAVFDKLPVSITPGGGPDGCNAVSTTGSLGPSRLPEERRKAVLDCVDHALDALGVTWRVTHTEVRVTHDRVEVIEVNGRVGGHVHRLLQRLHGPDLLRASLCCALGREPEDLASVPSGHAAALFPVFSQRSGPVRSKVRRAEVQRLPGVVAVDDFADSGRAREADGSRVATLRIEAEDQASLDQYVFETCDGLAALYASDGLPDEPWFAQFAGRGGDRP
ncbi:hypothetical protein KDL01_16735 [Actinospica durhamensis]|uniref:ATP-grasp domain-containing protein n=1 Tax=Actinospica durhamensis TaxID=1508375 RepID=A0A941ER15_9ACTN|nr:hypothetical protein [Actinospica durhamensis]MBR7834922.1 hypothetical protein [Actinospica durhamensis]